MRTSFVDGFASAIRKAGFGGAEPERRRPVALTGFREAETPGSCASKTSRTASREEGPLPGRALVHFQPNEPHDSGLQTELDR